MSEWQPIETAPKDGGAILLVCAKARTSEGKAFAGFMAVDGWDELLGWGSFNDHHWPATHWMPLPEPPSEDA